MKTESPVLFLIYNRPSHTREVFREIRAARPNELYISGDGAKPDVPEDAILVAEARRIVDQIDWECDVRVLFRDENLGLKRAVGDGINWFFEHVEEGIILEDDCVPHQDFFRFCDDLLPRYRNDERVSVVTGNNFQSGKWRGESSYYFSHYAHVWGWATWRRAWKHYDPEINFWPEFKNSSKLSALLGKDDEYRYWKNILDSVYAKAFETTWDYPWQASIWQSGGLTATPNVNLVRNIGFGIFSTHTSNVDSKSSNITTNNLGPLIHPKRFLRDRKADALTFRTVFKGKNPYLQSLLQRLNVLREIINCKGKVNRAK